MFDLVAQIVEQFKSKTQYQKFIRECDEKFQIKNYRFQQITPAQAKKGYNQLQAKYQQKIFQKASQSWYENERKLFIWFLLGLLKLQNWKMKQCRWEELSVIFFQKDVLFLKYQYNTIQKHKHRIVWTERQNQILRNSIQKYQKGQWNQIAKEIFFKTNGESYKASKQCRQRWQNHEDPNIIKEDWSHDQDLIILKFVHKQGKKWSKAAEQLRNTRTQHMIKNRFKSLIAKAQAKDNEKYQQQLIIQLIGQLQNKIQLADKVQSEVPQPKLLKKNSVQVWCFDKNADGKCDSKTSQSSPANFYFFQSKSPASIMMSTELPKFILTPNSLVPLQDPYSFANFTSQWNNRLRTKDSINSTYSCNSNMSQGMLYQARNDGNMQFSRQYDELRTGKQFLTPSPIERIQSRLFNKSNDQSKQIKKNQKQ